MAMASALLLLESDTVTDDVSVDDAMSLELDETVPTLLDEAEDGIETVLTGKTCIFITPLTRWFAPYLYSVPFKNELRPLYQVKCLALHQPLPRLLLRPQWNVHKALIPK